MKIPVFWAWSALPAALAGLLALEFVFQIGSTGYQAPVTNSLPAISAQTGGPIVPPQSANAAWGAVVLGRPILAQSRRPSQSPVIPVETPRLSGIMITPAERMAVLSPATGGPIIVARNSRFGPFTVLSITSNNVTLEGPSGVVVLHADFSHQGQSTGSAPAITIASGSIDLSQIRVPLPDAATWAGPPMVN